MSSAVISAAAFKYTFLYGARQLDPHVVAQLKHTEASVAEYSEIEARRLGIQVNSRLYSVVIALTILTRPSGSGLISPLAGAPIRPPDECRQYRPRPSTSMCRSLWLRSEGDLAQLGDTFNKIRRVAHPARRVGERQRPYDSRRRFIEAVLSSREPPELSG